MTTVPNQQPTLSARYRIAFIGEAPGTNEVSLGRPFVGPSGNLLWALAGRHGIIRDACFVGNVCQVQPPGNNIKLFDWSGPEIQSGLAVLWPELAAYKPNLCVLLGGTALRAFSGETAITKWRGSLFRSPQGYKCLATLHPAAILRTYSDKPLLDFDLRKAAREGLTPTLTLPERNLQVDLTLDQILQRLDDIAAHRRLIAIDIEGYVHNMSCISVAVSPSDCFVIPFHGWSLEDECRLWRGLSTVLADPSVPKILQNSLYDTFVLQYGHSIPVRGVVDDTMLAHWECFCEMEKSLGFQASIYTNEPYWKDERQDEDPHVRLLYAAKDSAVTHEIRNVIRPGLKGAALAHYNFNCALLDPLLYMELRGIAYDHGTAQAKVAEVRRHMHRMQWALDAIAGFPTSRTREEWLRVATDYCAFKKLADKVRTPTDLVACSKLTTLAASKRVETLLLCPTLTLEDQGELSQLLECGLNVNSPTQVADYLYRQLKLPVQYKKEHGRKTERETTDTLALLTLYSSIQDPVLRFILEVRALSTQLETLTTVPDPDGRVRCAYNAVGSETGRLTCYKSPTGSGFNLQTVTSKHRHLFQADPDYWFFQCDLSGADGWTVACHCAALGDPTMLEDMLAGIKVYKIISLFHLFGEQVAQWPRDQIKRATNESKIEPWLAFASKRVFHGGNYGMAETTMSSQILQDSYKKSGTPIVVSPATCRKLLTYKNIRWPGVARWHQQLWTKLRTQGTLTSASGHTRTFYGRKDDQTTFKAACADEPQNNTTYATNKALLRLWTDEENRQRLSHSQAHASGMGSVPCLAQLPPALAGGVCPDQTSPQGGTSGASPRRTRVPLCVQPLHQVHDALLGQFPKSETDWAVKRIAGYFDNPITIAGITVTIPFEGAYGRSWGELKEGVI